MSTPAPEAAAYDAWAEVYDVSDANRAPFYEFYSSLLREDTGSLLELGCGTGSVLIALAQRLRAGRPQAPVVGVDGSPGMISVARRRDAGIEWHVGDLRDPGLDRRFDLVLCAFNTLQHLLRDEDLAQAFGAARRLLAPGGRYAFDIYRPNLEYLRLPRHDHMAREVTDASGRALQIREDSSWDEAAQVLELDWRLVPADQPASQPLAVSHFRLRQFAPELVESLLAKAGLRMLERYGELDRSPFADHARKQIIVCTAD